MVVPVPLVLAGPHGLSEATVEGTPRVPPPLAGLGSPYSLQALLVQ